MSAAHGDVLIDAHVHYHAGFSRAAFFDAAVRNLRAGGRQAGVEPTAAMALMLTESAGVDAFARFAAEAAAGSGAESAAWQLHPGAEDNALWASSTRADAKILLIAGRQLVTRERLEVLALGCRDALPDGMALHEARDAVIEAGGVPVIPWGFGKWWSSRGRLLADLIEKDSPGRWFLGDNAGRPRLSRRPPLFARAARRGVFVLPGSDPLPLQHQQTKVGRCGFVMPGPLAAQRPAATILDWLRACAAQPATFGRYEGLARFARDQVAMQLRKGGAATDPEDARAAPEDRT